MTTALPTRLRTAALFISLALTAGCGDSADKMLASAKDYLAKNDSTSAVIQLKNALAKDPNSAEARFLLGRTLLDGGDSVAAEIELRKALDLKFSTDQVVPALARALLTQGQTKKLEELATQPVTAPEGLADLRTTLAQNYAMQGNIPQAHAMLQQALAAKPDFAPALLGQARLKVNENDLPGAYAILDSILAKTPQNSDAWLFKADLLRVDNRIAESVAAYEKGIAIHPQAILAHAALITIYLQEKKPESAVKQLAAMEKAAPRSPLTFYMQALTAFERKDYAAARSASENHIRLQPENPQGLQLAGQIAFASRSDIQAQEFLRKALSKAPELDRARHTLVMSYMRSGQTHKALETLLPVIRVASPRPLWLTLAGNVHLQTGDIRRAEEYFQRAADAEPNNKRAQTALALARLQTGHTAEALSDLTRIAAQDTEVDADMALIAASIRLKHYDKALNAIEQLERKQPNNPLTHNLRGGTLLGKGDRMSARASFEKALSIDPAFLPAASALAQMDLQERKTGDALKRYETVAAHNPKNAQAFLALADMQTRTGAAAANVSATLDKAIAAAPTDLAPRLAQIGHLVRQNDAKQALAAVQGAQSIAADNPDFLDAAGQVYQLNGDTNQALAFYGKLASLQPGTAHPYLRMAEIQAAAKNPDGARSSLQKGLTSQPDSLPLQRGMIMLDLDAKQFETALAKARQLQRAHPGEPAGHIIEGDIHVLNKAWAPAAAAYRAGLKAKPTTDGAERLHTVLLADQKTAEANAFADSWLKAHPKDSVFRMFLADTANKRKDYAAAVAQYRLLLTQQADNPTVLNNLAWSLGRLKDPKSISYAEQALKLAPDQPAVMDTLGVLLVDQGQTERGLDLLAKAIQLAPQGAVIRLNYAKALLKTGKKAEARQQLDELVKLGDKFPAHSEVAALLKGL